MIEDKQNKILARVKEDMPVFDVDGDKVGKVSGLYFGENDAAVRSTPGVNDPMESGLVAEIIDALVLQPEMPESLASRLRMNGFVRINRGLLSSDAFAMPDQIAYVAEEGVHLNVAPDELLTR